MDPRLYRYYNQELQHLRETAGEFAQEFPKIASRLSLAGFECADPYVERLLEGFAFLAGRIHHAARHLNRDAPEPAPFSWRATARLWRCGISIKTERRKRCV